MTDKRAVVSISGYNPRAVIAFSRWASQKDVNFHFIASGSTDPILMTKYASRVEIVRESKGLLINEFLSWIESVMEKYSYQQVLILPTTEFFNRFLLKNRVNLESNGCIIPLVEESLYLEISDKRKFANLCKSYGLDIPDEYKTLPDTPPFVAKPSAYFDRGGKPIYPHLITNGQEYQLFIEDENPDDYFYQEYVYGENHYLLAYIHKDGNSTLFSQENLIQQSRGKSVVLARYSQYCHSENAMRYIEMLKDIGFWGLIMIEVRKTETGIYLMIEANPRLWGPLQFVVDNHLDFFGMLLRENGINIKLSEKIAALTPYYYWSGGMTKESQPLTFHNFSGQEFLRNFHDIRPHDIYLRDDTLSIHLEELGIE